MRPSTVKVARDRASTSFDQFYTKDSVAKQCYETLLHHINMDDYDIVLEPSAGKGAFFKLFPIDKRVGLDIDPKCEGVATLNYFDFSPRAQKTYIVVGNPPFGRISSLAVKFFNHSTFAKIIAFIIPRTFKRVSIQNQLSLHFHLLYTEDLPLNPCCFEPKMSAKCCFQIWKREQVPRTRVLYDKSHKDFSFQPLGPKDRNRQPTPPTTADFALKAYGSHCGEILETDLERLRPKSWHWIKANIDLDTLKDRFQTLDYSMSKDTVRQDSIGQKELIYLYQCTYG